EGYELNALDPIRCPLLWRNDIIVECHDFLLCEESNEHNTYITDNLQRRFEVSHEVERITIQTPRLGDFPFLRDLPIGHALLAIMDNRPVETAWLACWAKQGENDG